MQQTVPSLTLDRREHVRQSVNMPCTVSGRAFKNMPWSRIFRSTVRNWLSLISHLSALRYPFRWNIWKYAQRLSGVARIDVASY